jgi:hypothetical protein
MIDREEAYSMRGWQHFLTITYHRWLVCKGCFRIGLYWQGLTHDLSKYSPTEFRVGARYYQGNRSPNGAEREEKGYSEAWIHHKGRNRHHFEYWNDLNRETKRYESVPMPRRFLAESVMDRIAASAVYEGEKYTDASALNYLERSLDGQLMHPESYRQIHFLLTMLKEKGEKVTFSYMKHHILRGKPFPWEETTEE